MEVLEPGQAGPLVAITTEAAQVPVCVGREPVTAPPLSVEAKRALGSVLKSPTVPGVLFWRSVQISV